MLPARLRPPRRALRSRVAAPALICVIGAIGMGGCFASQDGLSPPLDRFYYPTGLAVSEGGCALYVASSDFDLRYTGGTVIALDLHGVRSKALALRAALAAETAPGGGGAAAACAGGDVQLLENAAPLLHPGPCAPLGLSPYVRSSAIIGAFASSALLVQNPAGEGTGARLFVPVRGDPSVTYFELTDDRAERDKDPAEACGGGAIDVALDCGQSADDPRCTDPFRVGDNPYESTRGIRLPLEPIGVAATATGDAIVIAHQTQAAASLIKNPWSATARPTLEYAIRGLSDGPTELAPLPVPRFVQVLEGMQACSDPDPEIAYQPGFLLTFRAAPELDLLRFHDDGCAEPARPFLSLSTAIPVNTNANGADSRGVAVDASERQACEAACGDDVDCLIACADVPLQFFVANRAPASLLVGEARTRIVEDTSGLPGGYARTAYEELTVRDTVPLAYGASRVAVGTVLGPGGQPELRAFALAFDSRFVFSYDPAARRVDAVIRTGRGPHALAFDSGTHRRPGKDFDEPYAFMYVAHFTDSYVGVVDLNMFQADDPATAEDESTRPSPTFGSMILTLGQPVPPRESR